MGVMMTVSIQTPSQFLNEFLQILTVEKKKFPVYSPHYPVNTSGSLPEKIKY